MLKINKILSKKIQFPLSLRGLFPFCHSRESGNPSSLSLRGTKQGSNLKGFSLIELMVAVVILAIALIGIFLAFNSSWMGMADARDRTVATNYAQEILEDIKNKPFEKIHNESKSQISDTKFYRTISLNPNTNPNTKEVTAQVTWDNWRGSEKNVEVSTLIYSQFSSEQFSDAVTLVLYAKPYYNILPGSSNTLLTAMVKDKNGNLVTDWAEFIFFSIPEDYFGMGTVPTEGFMPNNGEVTGVIFISSGEFGEVVIEAFSGELTSDSVTLKVTDAAVAIKLEANPATISTEDQSIISVSLLDASYVDAPLTISEHLVTFNVIEGTGTITPISVLLNSDNKTDSILLTSSSTPGIVTIIASSIDLESGVINVPILGSAESISITSNPISIYLGGNTEITVTIKDSAGNPVAYEGLINLTLGGSGEGSLASSTLDYPTDNTTIFTAESIGEVNITASVADESLLQDTVTIYISKGKKIKLTAEPEIIIADGESISIITATILDINNEIVTNETYQIVFVIYSGEGYLSGPNPQETVDGVAEIDLISTIEPGIITVNARAMGLTPDSIDIQTIYPKFISLSADTNWLYEDGDAYISIDVVDSNGEPADYLGSINLTLSGSGSGIINPETLYYPDETTTIFTAWSIGEVAITADGDGVNSDSINIQILEEGEITLTLADNITTSDGGKTISFDISNDGSVGLEIVQMQVIWDPPSSNLHQVRTPTTSDLDIVYDGTAESGTLINIEPTILPPGISTIYLYFSESMNGKTITVIFFDNSDPQIQYGPLEFTIE